MPKIVKMLDLFHELTGKATTVKTCKKISRAANITMPDRKKVIYGYSEGYLTEMESGALYYDQSYLTMQWVDNGETLTVEEELSTVILPGYEKQFIWYFVMDCLGKLDWQVIEETQP